MEKKNGKRSRTETGNRESGGSYIQSGGLLCLAAGVCFTGAAGVVSGSEAGVDGALGSVQSAWHGGELGT